VEGAGAALVRPMGDGVADAPAAAGLANRPAAVPLVADDTPGARAGAAPPRALDGDLLQQPREHRRLVRLARRQDDGERLALPFRPEVDFRRVAAPAAAERLLPGPP